MRILCAGLLIWSYNMQQESVVMQSVGGTHQEVTVVRKVWECVHAMSTATHFVSARAIELVTLFGLIILFLGLDSLNI